MAVKQQAIRTVKSEPLQQQNIVIQQTQSKHIKAEPGSAYQVVLQKHNAVLEIDFNVLAKKQDSDLVLLLDDKTTLVFDGYFTVCLNEALSCVVSLPSDGGVYHISDGQSKILTDGTEVVYFYGTPSGLETIVANNNSHTLSDFVQQNQTTSGFYSPMTLGAGALGAIALAAGGGGSGSDSPSDLTKFIINGDISAGQVIEGHDLKLEAYDKNNDKLDADITIENNGSFSINIKEDYVGYIVLKITDGTNKDYIDEGTGEEKDLSLDEMRVIVSSDGKSTITAMINPLTEIITRKVFDSETKLDSVNDVAGDLVAANTAVGKAFNAEGVDISSTKPAVVNATSYDNSASAGAKALGYALAGISGMEIKDRNGDASKDTKTVLSSLVGAIDNNGVLRDEEKADFLAGLNQAKSKNSNMSDDYINQFYSSIKNIEISDDTVYGTSSTDSDFITKTQTQTITATLASALSNEKLWGSVDNGVTWENVTNKVNGSNVSWDDKDLEEGEHIIQFAITTDTINSSDQVNNNVKGVIAQQSYTLDTTAPEKANISKITLNNKIIGDGETTNGSTPSIRISLTNTNAEKDDKIQILANDGTGYAHSQYATLTQTDIDRDWKDVSLLDLTTSGNSNKEYGFQVRVIDQVGNQGELSDAYSITYDDNIEKLTLTLKNDTGTSDTDGVTSDKTMVIGNIEKDAKVEYILDGSDDNWLTFTSSAITYDNNDKGTAEIELNENTEYAANRIKVRQTDSAGNVNTDDNVADNIAKNSTWKIDNTAVVYDASIDEKISRVKNDDTNAFESHIVLTFTEDIVKLPTFAKNSFTIFIGTNQVAESDIKSVTTNGKEITITLTADVNAATELKLSYTQTDNTKALQDKAGNSLTAISEQTFTVDNVAPTKPTIISVVDNKGDSTGEVANDAITDDNTLTVKTTFSGMEKDEKLEYYNTEDGDENLIQTVVLTQADINNGYVVTTLSLDSSVEGKSYVLSAKLVDQTGNISDASDAKNFTVDASANAPTIELDTGSSNSDYITSNTTVEVSGIEKDAWWEYTIDGGDNWITYDFQDSETDTTVNGHKLSNSNDTTYSFDLAKNTTYDAQDIRVRQTDKAQNEADTRIYSKVVTDEATPEYQSKSASGNIITLTFSEDLYDNFNTTSSSATGRFVVDGNTVTKVNTENNKVHLTVSNAVSDIDAIEISYTKPTSGSYFLQDEAGNLVNNLKIGTKDDDTINGTSNNDTIIGGLSDDILSGNGGIDIFDYNNTTDGDDTITDFTIGNDGDKLDFKDLLVGYDASSTLSEFVTSEVSGSDTLIKVDANGTVGNSGVFTADIEITLEAVTNIDLSTMLTSGDLIVL